MDGTGVASVRQEPERFDGEALARLRAAVARAEELVGEHYRLSSLERDLGHYDILTASEHASDPGVEGVLAEVVHCSRIEALPPWSDRPTSFFRIHLYDDRILGSARRMASAGVTLDDLLLYVLTHELVHVVRFRRFLRNFHADLREVGAEETVVERETATILGRVGGRGMGVLLREYGGRPPQVAEERDGLSGPAGEGGQADAHVPSS